MGFLKPGKKAKRVRSENGKTQKPVKVKRIKLEASPKLEETVIPKTEIKENKSILERLPTEILHEIFTFASLTNLALVSKSLNEQLKPSKSLKISILKNFLVDLNNGIVAPEMVYKERFALEKQVLGYKFVTFEILREIKFDTVLPMNAIASETKNRLILYYDKLNQRLLETMRRAESTEEEINRELARIADENFNNINADNVELADAPEQEVQDFPQRFYRAPFSDDKLQMVKFLHTRGLQYIEGDTVLSNAMEAGTPIIFLEELHACSQTGVVESVGPLITAFEQSNMTYVEWIISRLKSRDLLNHDDLWIYIYQKQNTKFLHFLEDQGATPSHEVLGMLSSSHI